MRRLAHSVAIGYLFAFAPGCVNDITVPDSSGTPAAADPGLWTVSGSSSAILRLDPHQLGDALPVDASTVITTTSAALNTLAAVAFDTTGSLWVIGFDEPLLLGFAPGVLTTSGVKVARTTIIPEDGALKSATGLAFDSQQRLWIGDFNGTLNRFDVEQLGAGGIQSPAVVVHVPGNVSSIAFDASGSLWASDNVQNVISKYTATQLASSGSPVPEVVLTATDLSLVNPAGLAFDKSGSLWVANIGGRTLVSFNSTQLRRSGSPVPNVVITGTGGSLSVPVSIAFDANGDLWVVGATGALTKYARGTLGESGATLPAVRVQIDQRSLFWSIAFWPTPKGLPLGQRFARPLVDITQK